MFRVAMVLLQFFCLGFAATVPRVALADDVPRQLEDEGVDETDEHDTGGVVYVDEDLEPAETDDAADLENQTPDEDDSAPEQDTERDDAIDAAVLGMGRDVHQLVYLLTTEQLTTEEALAKLPDGSAEDLVSHVGAFGWGALFGFVAYLIGLSWRSAQRLMGLV